MKSTKRWPLLLLPGLLAAALAAQDPVRPADSDPEPGETLGEAALGGDDEEAGEETEPEAAAGPGEASAEGEAAAAGEVSATMERFVPSEQISEDRSVSFPNDI